MNAWAVQSIYRMWKRLVGGLLVRIPSHKRRKRDLLATYYIKSTAIYQEKDP